VSVSKVRPTASHLGESDDRAFAERNLLSCAEVHAERSERRRVLVLRCAAKDIRSPRNLDLVETAFSQERDELCFQQSARDSTGP
jgi:hypothetical protein